MGSACFYTMPGTNNIEPMEFFRILRVAYLKHSGSTSFDIPFIYPFTYESFTPELVHQRETVAGSVPRERLEKMKETFSKVVAFLRNSGQSQLANYLFLSLHFTHILTIKFTNLTYSSMNRGVILLVFCSVQMWADMIKFGQIGYDLFWKNPPPLFLRPIIRHLCHGFPAPTTYSQHKVHFYNCGEGGGSDGNGPETLGTST